MVYLDYAATTPVSKEVLKTFDDVSLNYIANANSIHKLGRQSKKLEEQATKQIASLLNVKPSEIIYTASSTEANNLAIFGIVRKYKNRGKHILTTRLEHSSVLEALFALEREGYEVEYLETDENGLVTPLELANKLRDDTILVSMSAVNSETGLKQDIEALALVIKKYPKCFFHVDMTQSIGKVDIDFTNIHLATFTPHKFYGVKGIGILVKKESIVLEPLIYGGKSTTVYRSGTPALPLICASAKALKLALTDVAKKEEYISKLKEKVISGLKDLKDIRFNNNKYCIADILSISILNIKPETMINALSDKEIYVATQTACASGEEPSLSVLEVSKDMECAKHSIRLSFSTLTTSEDIDLFIKEFKDCYQKLSLPKN